MGQYEGDLGHILEMFIIKVFCWRHSTTPLAIIKKFGFYIVMSSLNINQNTSFIKKSFLSFFGGKLEKGRGDLGQLLWGDMGQKFKGASNLGLLSSYTIFYVLKLFLHLK